MISFYLLPARICLKRVEGRVIKMIDRNLRSGYNGFVMHQIIKHQCKGAFHGYKIR
ncbi:hypothetical protein SAMN06296020_11151 [Anoxynatronum buryatiense]|uniref:Uncharacterized protein n=1 Tax=Anoxynatronum buryatiense TaxID=489973 RepID=A0AA45WXE0_9CLOT|nr:hypothetical protein SAMN06296020_11151 [Anoxynatronum buryatiense]